MSGFFSSATFAAKPLRVTSSCLPRCGACGLYRECTDAKIKPQMGDKATGLLIVVDRPSHAAASRDEHLTASEYAIFASHLAEYGVSRRNCVITSAVICPSYEVTDEQVQACLPNLLRVIDSQPFTHILLLGEDAARSLIPHLWGDNLGEYGRWVGWVIPSHELNAWVLPLPSIDTYEEEEDVGLPHVTRESLGRFFMNRTAPYAERSTEEAPVRLLFDPAEAARMLDKMVEVGGTVAVDYETTTLKPDGDDAEIVCMGVCWQGKRTFAYPWQGEAIEATSRLLRSDLPKIGANIKFEDRWTRAKLGHGVRNWVWDTMQAAHVLDNRSGITSVKFQAFVRLGRKRWDADVHQYLTSPHARATNQIKSVPLRRLLTYCALDAAYEYELAMLQQSEMGMA